LIAIRASGSPFSLFRPCAFIAKTGSGFMTNISTQYNGYKLKNTSLKNPICFIHIHSFPPLLTPLCLQHVLVKNLSLSYNASTLVSSYVIMS
jgi:hypothetical protein